jgi:DNA polymerase-3 subunit chi
MIAAELTRTPDDDMIRVDFYVHETAGFEPLALTACRLAEKAFMNAQRVFIHTDSEELARRLDERLWTFHDRSFVPHAIAGARSDVPVLIGYGQPPAETFDLLINIAAQVPDFYERSSRVADLVDADTARREQGRERYRYYRERGLTPETHKL